MSGCSRQGCARVLAVLLLTMESAAGLSLVDRGDSARYIKDQRETCTALANRGSYFAVETCVGTPETCFKAVADTGSDAVVIPSCVCNRKPLSGCNKGDLCFESTNSKTYTADEHNTHLQVTYGSGTITVEVGTDVVTVGGVKATIRNSLFLMENRKALEISGEFEGILGLGLPGKKDVATFAEEAHISRFSICFRDGGSPGALRFNIGELENRIQNIGVYHWGFAFDGASVGGTRVLCHEKASPEQETPCGIIPDSGTTQILGPKSQVAELEAALCDNWHRCRRMVNQNEMSRLSPNRKAEWKSRMFRVLLMRCSDWLEEDGMDSIPSIDISTGKTMFSLSSWAFVIAYTVAGEAYCESTFGVMEYPTEKNGPIWIFGTPLFYEFDVQYDLTSQEMALKREDRGHCRPCGVSGSSGLLADDEARSRQRPRRTEGKPRISPYDTRVPL